MQRAFNGILSFLAASRKAALGLAKAFFLFRGETVLGEPETVVSVATLHVAIERLEVRAWQVGINMMRTRFEPENPECSCMCATCPCDDAFVADE